MSTPAAYAKMKEKQKQAEAVATAQAKAVHVEREAEERELYDKFAKALRPYRNCELGKRKITVKFLPKEMGIIYLTPVLLETKEGRVFL